MKLFLSILFVTILILGVMWVQTPSNARINIVSHIGFAECEFNLEYGVDSTFSDFDYNLIFAAASKWIIVSNKRLCFTFYTVDVKWYDYFYFPFDRDAKIYNTHGGVWQQANMFLNPYCQRIGCIGLSFETRDIFLTHYNIYLISIHEIGHTLGLSHSADQKDIMYHQPGTIDISIEDKRTLKCLMDDEPPLRWGNPNCFYKNRGIYE